MKIVFEITQERRSSSDTVRALRRAADRYQPQSVFWFVRRDQVELVAHDRYRVIGESLSVNAVADEVIRVITGTCPREGANQVCIFASYQGPLLGLVGRKAHALRLNVVPTTVISFAAPEPGSPSAPLGQSKAALSVEEAAEVALHVLHMGRHHSPEDAMRNTDLRPAMHYLDPRTRKDPLNPDTFGLVGRVLAELEHRGWARSTLVGRTPAVYLTQAGQQVAARLKGRLDASSPFALDSLQPPPAELREGSAESDAEASGVHGHQASNGRDVVRAEPQNEVPLYRELQGILNLRGIGSPPWARRLVLAEIQEVLGKDCESMPLQKLFALARDRVLEKHAPVVESLVPSETGAADSERTAKIAEKWRATVNCVKNLCLAAGVLFGEDDTPIRGVFDSDSVIVKRLDTSIVESCDAYLLHFLIRKRKDGVQLSERKALTRALWGEARVSMPSVDDLELHLARLFAILKSQGKTEEVGEGRIVATDQPD